MKKNIKSGLIGLLMGVLLTSGIGAVAVTLTADQVKYKPSNDKFTATNVKEAMDEIYKIAEYEIPADTYFYDSETSGEDIVRYKKVDGKYYLCDKNGKITNDTEQDVSNLTLVEYKSAASGNINMGNAAYSDNNFILGDDSSTKTITMAWHENTTFQPIVFDITKVKSVTLTVTKVNTSSATYYGIGYDNAFPNIEITHNTYYRSAVAYATGLNVPLTVTSKELLEMYPDATNIGLVCKTGTQFGARGTLEIELY